METPEALPTPLPQVTVVIPTKDRPEFLSRSVASALAQVDVDLEVIVVDDGGRVPAIEHLETNPRVRVLRNAVSQGVARARNRGVEAANFTWIAFLDDDDIWAPHNLATQIRAMATEARRWSHSTTVRLTAELEIAEIIRPTSTYSAYPAILQLNGVTTPSSVVIDAALIDDAGGFDPCFSLMADWDLWVRVAQLERAAIVDEPLVGYVVHAGSMHRQGTLTMLGELRAFKAKYRGGPPIAGPYTWKWIADTHRRTGHLLSSLPLYALPLVMSPLGIIRARRMIIRGLRSRAVRFSPRTRSRTAPELRPGWLQELDGIPPASRTGL